jgi:uncharacterized protein YecE (DUF72 family)
MPLIIGTSGWQYADWRGRLYPQQMAQAQWLAYYAEHFGSVEVNSAFYRLPECSTFERWRDSTPPDFTFSVKASRYLTHILRLRRPTEPIRRLMERASNLEKKLGPILLQIPGNLSADVSALRRCLRAFPADVRVAFEPRHASWYTEEVAGVLAEHDAALCLSDTPERTAPRWRTASWGYVRFHQGRAHPFPCYGRKALTTWARRLAELWGSEADIFAYFNNDQGGCAVRDAHRFALAASHAGLNPTRVPTAQTSSLTTPLRGK